MLKASNHNLELQESHIEKVGEAGQANNALHFNGSQSTLQNLVKFQHTPECVIGNSWQNLFKEDFRL